VRRAGEISERLASVAEQVASMLLPRGKRSGQFWTAGDTGGGPGESLKVYLSGPKAGRWTDYATGQHGDLLDLWAETRRQSITEAMSDAGDWLGIRAEPFRHPARSYSKPKPISSGLSEAHVRWLETRKLHRETVDLFGLKSDGEWIAFEYLDPDGEVFATKYRTTDKRMRSAAGCRPGLYGWQALDPKARSVALVEGELDAIALTQYGMPSLSVPNGGGGQGKQSHWIEEEFDRLERFDVVYVVMDADGPGQEAAAEIIDRLGPERCRLVQLPFKDANECLIQGIGKEALRQSFRDARSIDPEELRKPSEYHDLIVDQFHGKPDSQIGFTWPLPYAREELRFRPGEVVVVAGPNGSGKSQFCGQTMLEAMDCGQRSCVASMEFNPHRYLARMYRQAAAERQPTREYLQAITRWMDEHLWVFDLVGTAKTDRMLEVFRYARRKYGIRVFLIDNLAKCGFAEDDYNSQKTFVDQLTDFAKECDATVFLVHHMRKGGQDKDGVKGTGAITDMVDSVLLIWRNKDKEDALKINPQDPDWIDKPDGAVACRKQRNGEAEPTASFRFDVDTFQFIGKDQSAKPSRYVQWSAIEARRAS